jgi:hypothetical protein
MPLSNKEKGLVRQREILRKIVPQYINLGLDASKFPFLNKAVRQEKVRRGQKQVAINLRKISSFLDPNTKKGFEIFAIPPLAPTRKK